MTDITTTAPISVRRPSLPAVSMPRFGIGRALAALCQGFGQAVRMAYIDPYRVSQTGPVAAPDPQLEGRDPNW